MRFIRSLVNWSAGHPRLVLALTILLTVAAGAQLPRIRTDTDPKNMLPITSPVRQYNDQVEAWFGLPADVIVLGIRNDAGLFNRDSLGRVARITEEILRLPGVIARDVVSLPTVDDVAVEGEALRARPLLDRIPDSPEALEGLRRQLQENRLLTNRLLSADGKTTAVYVPIEKTANGKLIADQIRAIVGREKGPERFFLAGDPVSRDTFGIEMFRQMGLFSPLAGMVMFIVLYLMFRSWGLVIANMVVAMLSIIWAMGTFIGLGIPIHIMASMSPVFLMAISTDTVHIFNEFFFRLREVGDRDRAIRETMDAVAIPVLFSDLTTAVGFASLAIGPIIPVRIFGLLVAFGTLLILLMSFTVVPAIMALLPKERLARFAAVEGPQAVAPRWLTKLGEFSIRRRRAIALVGLLLVLISAVGISRIRINNNMLAWFKAGSEIRQADKVLNESLGGTSTLYLVHVGKREDAMAEPGALRRLEELQRHLEGHPLVGKTISVADYVKRVSRVLHRDDPRVEVIPDEKTTVAQYLLLLGMAAKPRDLANVIDDSYQKANVIVQLRSWDAAEARALLEEARGWIAAHPFPEIEVRPAGIAYFNMVWNDEVLVGMLEGFIASLILVLLLLMLNYRSLRWGLVSFLPLLFTVVLIYGVVGFIGKDFDMPISVLSTLSLGLAIDFAIHFVSRFQRRFRETGEMEEALRWTVGRPGRGILRNAVLFASGFAVMLFAALTPYITVGAFMVAIMLLSAVATLVYLPALIALFPRWLLKRS